ncbi:HXK2 protein, partial [Fregetta grallaria]|nr:HXK2 protein [Fregetta grallaria]
PALMSCPQVQRALLALTVPLETLQAVKGRMLQAMRKGLSRQTHAQANVRMLPTYICSTPNGTGKTAQPGDGLLYYPQRRTPRWTWPWGCWGGVHQSPASYGVHKLPCTACASPQCRGRGQEPAPLAPAVVSGSQEPPPWVTDCPWDWVRSRFGGSATGQLYHVDVVALMNDTVGTMMTCSMGGNPCEIALVMGEQWAPHMPGWWVLGGLHWCSPPSLPADKGTNSCFMAEAQQVEMAEETSGRMCVNTEWGCFGDDGTLNDVLTSYDQHVDQESSNPGEKRFEKLVGSLYLGEIVRHALTALAAEKALFIGSSVAVLRTKDVLKTQQVLEIIDNEEGMAKARRALEALGLQPNERDCCRVQQICRVVVSRAAALCAAGLAAILSHMCQSRELEQLVVNVGVDGELYRGHSRFREILQSVTGLLAPECTATLLPSVDGTGRGAAMVTAVALRLAAQRREVDLLLAPLRLSRADLERVQALMRREMELGLGRETNANASVRMLPTYVRGTPDGTERGEFLALDLGGTNFRVLVVRVAQDGIRMASEIYVIPTTITQGTGQALFDHIIECIMDFQLKQDLMEQVLPLGFTFSFPCQQLGLDKAVLLTWTKGFSASGCVGQDVVQLLREAAQRKQHLGLKVVAVVNDTVGTMMSCGYDDPKCEIGLIVGTGTNACYMEEMQNVGTVEGEQGRMCINMEWGAFGDNGCLDDIFTDFDRLVDEKTINVGKQRFEKLISGMYLGEIVRHILLALVEKQLLFSGKPCPKLQTRDIFQTKFLSTIEIDGLGLRQVRAILQDLELQASFEDSVLVREVCQTVSLRAAQLCAAGLAAVVEKMRENRGLAQLAVTVGVDGTLYKMHPRFSQHLQQMLRDLAPNCTVTFLQSEDGSGKGAALVAAVACREAEPQ